VSDFFSSAFYAVEASSYESLCLWREAKDRVDKYESLYFPLVKSSNVGQIVILGHVTSEGKELPVVMCGFMYEYRGKKICMYEATSRAVDYDMIKAFWKKLGIKTTNAMNFGNVIHAVNREINAEKDKPRT